MGGGSTIAAAVSIGHPSIGLEIDTEYFEEARSAIPMLAALDVADGRKNNETKQISSQLKLEEFDLNSKHRLDENGKRVRRETHV